MPPYDRCLKNKWVFEGICNSVYQLWLVACGYSQVLGVNSSESCSPVGNNIKFCILLLMVIHFGFSVKIVNVVIAFFYRDMEVEINVDCPQEMSDIGKDDCISLNKFICGLVQAVRQYFKKAIEILNKWGFVGGDFDIIYVTLHIDNKLMVGDVEDINETITVLK